MGYGVDFNRCDASDQVLGQLRDLRRGDATAARRLGKRSPLDLLEEVESVAIAQQDADADTMSCVIRDQTCEVSRPCRNTMASKSGSTAGSPSKFVHGTR